ncbi:HAD hydrolase-like protein [archaeon]|nr:HAD hydrolase-like protein [archaeon]
MLLIFDLDNTLYPTHEQVIQCREAAVKAMMKRGLPGTYEEIRKELNKVIKEKGSNYNQHFDLTVKRMTNLSRREQLAIITAGVTKYNTTKQELMKPYSETTRVLKKLKKKHNTCILTKGKEKKQWDKINRLGLYPYFKNNVWIVSDEESKETAIKKILKKFKTTNALLIGDRPDSDIKAANKTGIKSAQLMKGPYKNIKGPEPDYKINNLKELLKLLKSADD